MVTLSIRQARTEDGVRVAYGFLNGSDPVVLFAPLVGHQFEIVEQVPSWREYRDSVRRQNAWAIVDWRGNGLSTQLEEPASSEQFAHDLRAVIDAINRPVILVGWGADGGGPALTVGADADSPIVGLCLIAPGRVGPGPHLAAMLRETWEEGWFVLGRWAYDWHDTGALRIMARDYVARLNPYVYWDQLRVASEWDLAGLTSRSALPLLLVAEGSADASKTAELASGAAAAQMTVLHDPILKGATGATLREAMDRTFEALRASTHPSLDLPLSERELEVVRLIAEGQRNAQIAEILTLSVRTVEFHLGSIYRKIGVTNRAGAAAWAVESGAIPAKHMRSR